MPSNPAFASRCIQNPISVAVDHHSLKQAEALSFDAQNFEAQNPEAQNPGAQKAFSLGPRAQSGAALGIYVIAFASCIALVSLGLFLGYSFFSQELNEAELTSQKLSGASAQAKRPKNIIFLIGDGMGPQQLGLLFDYNTSLGRGESALQRLSNEGSIGLLRTASEGSFYTDSAAAATALACGQRTLNGYVAMDSLQNPLPTAMEDAQDAGMLTALVTTTHLTHATPASFAAHVKSRELQPEIARQLIASRVDLMLGGGAKYFFNRQTPGNTTTATQDLGPQIAKAGIKLIRSRQELQNPEAAKGKRVLGLFAQGHLPYKIDRDQPGEKDSPSLPQMTRYALDYLTSTSNKEESQPFFMMVEGGRIDHAGHLNDVAATLGEMIEFDETVSLVLDFCKENPDTLLVVTADHETGGLCISQGGSAGSFKANHEIYVRMSSVEKSLEAIPTPAGLNLDFKKQVGTGKRTFFRPLYWGTNSRALRRSESFNVSYATDGHSTTPVTIMAYGPMASEFDGIHDNTHCGQLLRMLCKSPPN